MMKAIKSFEHLWWKKLKRFSTDLDLIWVCLCKPNKAQSNTKHCKFIHHFVWNDSLSYLKTDVIWNTTGIQKYLLNVTLTADNTWSHNYYDENHIENRQWNKKAFLNFNTSKYQFRFGIMLDWSDGLAYILAFW